MKRNLSINTIKSLTPYSQNISFVDYVNAAFFGYCFSNIGTKHNEETWGIYHGLLVGDSIDMIFRLYKKQLINGV